jgi:4-hydroxybenzoate polyprenyltransferase
MKILAAFFRLVRFSNLLFIALTQILFRVFILPFIYESYSGNSEKIRLTTHLFLCLVAASVCIAAAGYIINDYFDVNIDLINKPSKLIIGRFIKRRWAIIFHVSLSAIGLVLSIYIGWKLRNPFVPVFNFLAIAALWFYSTTFKKKLLLGNLLISLLTAWVILVITFSEYRFQINPPGHLWKGLLKLSFVYAGFAFITSIVREAIKDMEDLQGDSKYGCTTMPIVWGLRVSKVFVAVWLVVMVSAIAAILIYIIQLGWYSAVVYAVIAVIIPLLWIFRNLYGATTPEDFHRLSSGIKLVMLTGILSMLFF